MDWTLETRAGGILILCEFGRGEKREFQVMILRLLGVIETLRLENAGAV